MSRDGQARRLRELLLRWSPIIVALLIAGALLIARRFEDFSNPRSPPIPEDTVPGRVMITVDQKQYDIRYSRANPPSKLPRTIHSIVIDQPKESSLKLVISKHTTKKYYSTPHAPKNARFISFCGKELRTFDHGMKENQFMLIITVYGERVRPIVEINNRTFIMCGRGRSALCSISHSRPPYVEQLIVEKRSICQYSKYISQSSKVIDAFFSTLD